MEELLELDVDELELEEVLLELELELLDVEELEELLVDELLELELDDELLDEEDELLDSSSIIALNGTARRGGASGTICNNSNTRRPNIHL